MKKLILILILLFAFNLWSSNDLPKDNYRLEFTNSDRKNKTMNRQSILQGVVVDRDTREPYAFVNIELYKKGILITRSSTDFDGKYVVTLKKSGTYSVKVNFIGFETIEIDEVVLKRNKTTIQNFELTSNGTHGDMLNLNLKSMDCSEKISPEDIKKLPTRSDAKEIKTEAENNYKAKIKEEQALSTLRGKIFDLDTKEMLPFVKVLVYQNEKMKAGVMSDFEGLYKINHLEPGKYDVTVSYVGYESKEIHDIVLRPERIKFQDVGLSSNQNLDDIIIIEYDYHSTKPKVKKEDISRMQKRPADSMKTPIELPDSIKD